MVRVPVLKSPDDLTGEARRIAEKIVDTRKSLEGPFSVWMHAPEWAARVNENRHEGDDGNGEQQHDVADGRLTRVVRDVRKARVHEVRGDEDAAAAEDQRHHEIADAHGEGEHEGGQ